MFTGVTIGQYVPVESVIHNLDPRTKLLLTLIAMVAVLAAGSGWGLVLVTGCIAILVFLTRVPWLLYFRGMKPLFILVAVNFLIQLFMVPGEPLLQWRLVTITRQGLTLALVMTARLVLLFIIAQLLTFTTSPVSLIDGIERLLSPLRRLGVPAHELAMVMSIALRFIPVFYEESEKIVKAQVSRGADFESGNLITRARNLSSVLVPLFIKALRRADDLALAMEVRCYAGGEGRTRLRELRMREADYLFLAGALLAAVGVRLAGMHL